MSWSNGYDEITQINPSALQAQRRPQANPGWAMESGGFGVYAGICGKIDGLGHHPHFIPLAPHGDDSYMWLFQDEKFSKG
jgi:hypothetical protein